MQKMQPELPTPRSRLAGGGRHRMSARFWRVLIFIFLVLVSVAMAVPFLWMLSTALKSPGEILIFPPKWIPDVLRWDNFVTAWNLAPFGRFYLNSTVVAVVGTLLELLVGLLSAYAFARVRFPGRELVFLLVLATLMIPGDVTILPNYVTLANLGWINTYWALIIPPAANAFGTFLLRQHILSLPEELFDAAKLDGANHLHILRHIIFPLSWPIIATLILLGFIGKWNAYLWPLIVTNTENMRTLPIGLVYLRSAEGGSSWHLLMAATTFVLAPIIVIFLFTQKQFISGITRGAVRGGG